MRLYDLIAQLKAVNLEQDLTCDPKVMIYSEETESWYDVISVDYDSTMNAVVLSCEENNVEEEIECEDEEEEPLEDYPIV
jgi:hypothetical protein